MEREMEKDLWTSLCVGFFLCLWRLFLFLLFVASSCVCTVANAVYVPDDSSYMAHHDSRSVVTQCTNLQPFFGPHVAFGSALG